jgi:hypothetical protein
MVFIAIVYDGFPFQDNVDSASLFSRSRGDAAEFVEEVEDEDNLVEYGLGAGGDGSGSPLSIGMKIEFALPRAG